MAFVEKREGRRSGKRVAIYWDARWDETRDGKRISRSKTFATQKEASAFLSTIGVRKPGSSQPLKVLTTAFLTEFENAVNAKQREESTLKQLREHIRLHILNEHEEDETKRDPFGLLKCGDIGTPEVQEFLDRLYLRVSPAMAAKVRTTLSQIFKFGSRRGYVNANPVRDTKLMLSTRVEAGEAGERFILPPKADLKRLLKVSRTFDNTGRAEAIIRVLMFGGLRASELRGLPLRALSLKMKQPKLRVDQRADRYDEIGPVKSKAGRRDVVLGGETVAAIEKWLEAKTVGKFVFPNEVGNVCSYQNLWNRFWVPLMNRAGLVTDEPASATVRNWSAAQADFKQPRWGVHMLRHVYASLQIEQGVTPKRLQSLMGHSTLRLTMDLYGHLWPDTSEDERAASVEKALG